MKALVIMFSFLASLMFGVSAHAMGSSSTDSGTATMESMQTANPDSGDSSSDGDDDDNGTTTSN